MNEPGVEKLRPGEAEYMTPHPDRREEAILHATSEDDARWVKPQPGFFGFKRRSRNNIVACGSSRGRSLEGSAEGQSNPGQQSLLWAEVAYLQLKVFSGERDSLGQKVSLAFRAAAAKLQPCPFGPTQEESGDHPCGAHPANSHYP